MGRNVGRSGMTTQEIMDTFYWRNGPCCAGCDHWESLNSRAGLCNKAAPIPANERAAMLDISSYTMNIGCGPPLTLRDYKCGSFKDDFDWSVLPPGYLRRIGAEL